jgi:uncharacterized protein (TIGR02246 family)
MLTAQAVRKEHAMSSTELSAVTDLYHQLIDGWNRRDGAAMAALFTEHGNMVGFDGSQVNGRDEIESHLSGIFAHHRPAEFIVIVRDIRLFGADAALLRAVAGMVPPGKSDIMRAVNAIQSLVASRHGADWRIELFQNTPAAWHDRPEDTDRLTAELQAAFNAR